MVWHPSETDYADAIASQNPWHRSGEVPWTLARERKRTLAKHLWRSVLDVPIRRFQLVIGPRRVGKTVVMYQTVQQLIEYGIETQRLWWLHLAHPLLMDIDLGMLVQYVATAAEATNDRPVFVFLDEITYARRWDSWLKAFYDEQWPIRIVATSSSTAALQEGRVESGVGRFEERYLPPCLFPEYLELAGKPFGLEPKATLASTMEAVVAEKLLPSPDLGEQRQRFMLVGGFPELLMQPVKGQATLFDIGSDLTDELYRSQQVLRSDAVQKAIYQDIPQVFGVREPMSLERLLYTLAGQIGGLVSANSLAKAVRVAAPTVENYITYLERSFLIFLLHAYAPSEAKAQRRGRKVYFIDAAVRNAALQRGIAPLSDPAEMGVLLENMVASHLHALAQQSGVRLYHWRERKQEVDLVYDHPTEPLVIEVASGRRHSIRSLKALQAKYPRFRGRCYIVAPNVQPAMPKPDGTIGRVPLDLFLIAAGVQAEHDLSRQLATSPEREAG